ncbi:cytochrome P450, partial [Suillus discolor]
DLGYIAGMVFGAGSETTVFTITIIMMAAATHTDAQAHIQEELDNVVGHTQCRLCLFFVHQLTQITPDQCRHLLIRKCCCKSFRAIANDPEVFPEPHKFNPQHWIDDAGRVRGDLKFFTFGFGHRQHVVNQSVFINTALILWAFRLLENPAAKIDTLAFSDIANIHATPFEICFTKRIDKNVIRELCAPGK